MLHSVGNFIVTTDSIDRHSERVLPSGAKIKSFKSNPVMLYNHLRPSFFSPNANLPIGKWGNISIGEKSIEMEAFISDGTDESRKVLELVKDGVIRTASIGFRPLKWSDDEKDKLPGQKGLTITEYELIEVSLVDIPANPDAVQKSIDGSENTEDSEPVYGSVKSWVENGCNGIVIKSFVNSLNMDIIKVVNKFLGTNFGNDAKPEDVEKAFEKFSANRGVAIEEVEKALEKFDGEVKSFVADEISKLNVKELKEEIELLKEQLAEVKNAGSAPDADGGDFKEKNIDSDVEVIDARKWFNLSKN